MVKHTESVITSSVLAPQWKLDMTHLHWLSHDTGHHRGKQGGVAIWLSQPIDTNGGIVK